MENPETFFSCVELPTSPSRDPLKASSYEGSLWKQKLEHVLMPMIEQYDVVPVDDADHPIQW